MATSPEIRTFRAKRLPMNLCITMGPHMAGIVRFNADGYYTTDDPDTVAQLLSNYGHLVTEVTPEAAKDIAEAAENKKAATTLRSALK